MTGACTSDANCGGASGSCSLNQEDLDSDMIGDVCDNCAADYNSDQADSDSDELGNVCDNCPLKPNSEHLGTCYSWSGMTSACTGNTNCGGASGSCSRDQEDFDSDLIGDVCDNCPNTPNLDQLDTSPPHGNGIGDMCDCEADFDCNQGVDSEDVTRFLWDFSRSELNNPCINDHQCYGDFSCDGDVDAEDVITFLEDFGRNQFYQPCPACIAGNWCEYP
jgi:hypothetical protein